MKWFKFLMKIILIVLIFWTGYMFGKNSLSTNVPNKTPSPIPTIFSSNSKAFEYLNLDHRLFFEKNNIQQPLSYLFAIKINPFDRDWTCDHYPQFTDYGLNIYCRNTKNNSSSFSKLTISAKEYNLDLNPGATNAAQLVNNLTDKKTNKGIGYSLKKINLSKYTNKHIFTFYSPYELPEILSKYGGMMQGNDFIYGQYIIETTINGDDINDQTVIQFGEKIIDSIEFVKIK